MSMRRLVLIAGCLVTLAAAAPAAAQSGWSVMTGVGQPVWSGPYVRGGKLGISLLGVAIDRAVREGWTARLELAGQADVGDLGITGLFEQPTSVTVYRAHLAAIARRRMGSGPFFIDAGAAVWRNAGCDVDTSGGPGFFGGETVGCTEWSSDASSPELALRPRSTGVNLMIGAGLAGRHFGVLVRVEPVGTPVISTERGAIRARSLVLAVEWRPSPRS